MVGRLPSRELTYPPDVWHIWVDDFPFPNFPRWEYDNFPYFSGGFRPIFIGCVGWFQEMYSCRFRPPKFPPGLGSADAMALTSYVHFRAPVSGANSKILRPISFNAVDDKLLRSHRDLMSPPPHPVTLDKQSILVGGFKYFLNFHTYLGKWSILTNIFQMGCWNHQLVVVASLGYQVGVSSCHLERLNQHGHLQDCHYWWKTDMILFQTMICMV